MNELDHNSTRLPFIADLCAHLSDDEISAAEDRFWGYVEIVRRIHARLERERESRFDNPEKGF